MVTYVLCRCIEDNKGYRSIVCVFCLFGVGRYLGI